MKIFTCTPVDFKGDHTFFSRDSGLLSRGFAQIGIESRAIMPGSPRVNDDPALMRVDYAQLESSSWWKSLRLDGLALYSWASPRYNAIAAAVNDAGIPLLVNMDTSGLLSPLANSEDWYREIHVGLLDGPKGFLNKAKTIGKVIAETAAHPVARRRLDHFKHATAVGIVTPHAARWIANEVRRLGHPELAHKMTYLPHAQLADFRYAGTPKENLVISVGRWKKPDWPQKNPKVLLQAYRIFLSEKPGWKAVVIGSGAPELSRELGIGFGESEDRMEFIDYVKAAELPEHYQRAKIGFWPSRWEGQQGTAAQALCCGCSVVSNSAAKNNCFRHYVSRESGRLAARNTPSALADELLLEADAWERGERDPHRISRIWSEEFHAPNVARRALESLHLASRPAGRP